MHGEFKIGEFSIQPRTSTISKEGKVARVEPKVMDLLVYLARHAGQPVEKGHILRDVWGGSFVTEEVLSNSVWKLRHVFGDDPKNPRFIETIHKKGYRLLAPVCFRESPHPAGDSPRPLVGHDKEWAELQDCFNSTLSGRGLLVCVSGEAGIGKTTLIQNFLYPHADQDCFVGRGKCSERLAGTGAFLPILEALDNLTHSGTNADLVHLLRHKAPCWYVQVFPQAEDAPALSAQTAGSTLERMKRELTGFLREVSDIQPVLLFFDDVHWADDSSVDIWTYLCDRCSSMRILILVAYRPELLLPARHVFVPLKQALLAQGICREVPLSLLTEQNIATYIDRTFPGHSFPREFVRFIYMRTEGNPLFMVALLAHLRHLQVITPDGDDEPWLIRKELSGIKQDIPQTVQGLIDLKTRLLGEENRRLLLCAAVQGMEFDSAVLARALAVDPPNVEAHLEDIDRLHGFVRRLPSPISPGQHPTVRYQFAHILYLNALNESLGASRKASLSAAVAGAFLTVHSDRSVPLASRLALLYEAAGNFERAVHYFMMAARQAVEISADPEAAALARKGLGLLSYLPDVAEQNRIEIALHVALAIALTRTKGYGNDEARESFSRAYALCSNSDDCSLISRTLGGLAESSIAHLDLKAAMEMAEQFATSGNLPHDSPHFIWFSFIASLASGSVGKPITALKYAERAIRAYKPEHHRALISIGGYDVGALGLGQYGWLQWMCGYPDQARLHTAASLALAAGFDHPYTVAFILFMASRVYRYLGDWASSLQRAEEALRISEHHGFLLLQGWSAATRGWALTCQGHLEEGSKEIDRGLHLLRSIGCEFLCTEFLCLKAEALSRMGETARALATLDAAVNVMESGDERFFEAEMHRIRAGFLLAHSAAESRANAESWLRRAVALARQQGSKSFELRATTALARQCLDHGRLEEAYGELSPIYSWFTEGFDTPDLRAARDILQACRENQVISAE